MVFSKRFLNVPGCSLKFEMNFTTFREFSISELINLDWNFTLYCILHFPFFCVIVRCYRDQSDVSCYSTMEYVFWKRKYLKKMIMRFNKLDAFFILTIFFIPKEVSVPLRFFKNQIKKFF